MNGVLIVDKPQRITSFGVVSALRRILHTKKIGHMGTLDPMATGVLPVLIGSATKAQVFIGNHDKEYIATLKFGLKTDTLDITGNTVLTGSKKVDKLTFFYALNNFTGNIKQIPPMYSALKRDGKKLYELAREGITVEREPRDIKISELELISFDYENQTAVIRVLCSKGTYIRTLCCDIAESIGSLATLIALRRTKACTFTEKESITIQKIEEMQEDDLLTSSLIHVENLFNFPKLYVSKRQAVRFKNGGTLSIDRLPINLPIHDDTVFSVYEIDAFFLGIGKANMQTNEIEVLKLF